MIVNVELERICKYAAVVYFKMLSQRLPVEIKQNHNISVKVTGLRGQKSAQDSRIQRTSLKNSVV
jgi:hypothetical protein